MMNALDFAGGLVPSHAALVPKSEGCEDETVTSTPFNTTFEPPRYY